MREICQVRYTNQLYRTLWTLKEAPVFKASRQPKSPAEPARDGWRESHGEGRPNALALDTVAHRAAAVLRPTVVQLVHARACLPAMIHPCRHRCRGEIRGDRTVKVKNPVHFPLGTSQRATVSSRGPVTTSTLGSGRGGQAHHLA